NLEQGVGVRAMCGEKTGFAYSDEIQLNALLAASKSAKAIARGGQQASVQAWRRTEAPVLYQPANPLQSLTDTEKVALLEAADQEARRVDPRVKQVFVSLAGVHEVMLVAASDGTLASDIRPLVRLNVTVIVEENGRREQASHGGGARLDYRY